MPPADEGAHETLTVPSLDETTTTSLGVLGGSGTVSAFDGGEASPGPTPLVATTLKV
jgi:hypothetical protein